MGSFHAAFYILKGNNMFTISTSDNEYNASDREIIKCYYEFYSTKDISPTCDFIEPGLYYTNEAFEAMAVQADRVWYALKDGSIIRSKPYYEIIGGAERTWIEIKAQYLNWAMVK